jgi:hypothetical protein
MNLNSACEKTNRLLEQKRTALQGKSHLCIPFLGTARPQSQFPQCRNWETEHYNSVLEITVSFLGIHQWEPDIYIGFLPALHLQCVVSFTKFPH